jgi:hypothetical protein
MFASYALWFYITGNLTSSSIATLTLLLDTVAYPGILFGGGSTNSVEDRGQRELGSGGSSPLLEVAVISYKKFHFI